MYSSARLKSIQSTLRNTAKIACSVICIICSGFEIKEQEAGYPFWYTASKHNASLRERLCFNPPREVSVGETNQPPKHHCLLQPLSVLPGGLPGCVSRARDSAVPSKVGSQAGQYDQGKYCQGKYYKRCVCCIAHSHIASELQSVLFCFSCGYIRRELSVTI